jgi:hypothetical protein
VFELRRRQFVHDFYLVYFLLHVLPEHYNECLAVVSSLRLQLSKCVWKFCGCDTFVIYQFRCFRSVSQLIVCIDADGDSYWPSEDDNDTDGDGYCLGDDFFYTWDFSAGPGWIALAARSWCGFKILDILFNMAIPTPTICRDREEQRLYEVLATTAMPPREGDD